MTTKPDLSAVRALHDQRRTSGLSPEQATEYRSSVDQLFQATLDDQGAARRGANRRRGVRVPKGVAVELTWPGGRARTMTLDVSLGGFCVPLGDLPPADASLVALVHLRRGEDVCCKVRIAAAHKRNGRYRVSLAITEVPELDAARLKSYVVEALLPAARAARREPDVLSSWAGEPRGRTERARGPDAR